MATSESQKRAPARYQQANTKMRSVRFYPSERDILAWLDAQPNKQGYIKDLIRADMEQRKSE